MKENEDSMTNLPDYDDYFRWKKSVDDWGDFFELSDSEAEELEFQFKESNIIFKSNYKILELGFGSGKILKFFNDRGCSVEGIEIQDNLNMLAKEKGFKCYKNIEDSDGGYDLIVGFDVLEHMTLNQLKELFKHAANKLKPSGKMLFRFPNGDSYAGMPAQNGDYTHITSIGQSKLRQIIEQYGFGIESFKGRVSYPPSKIKNLFLKLIRWPFIKIIGFNIPYFFSGNVVAVVKFVKK